MLAIPPGCRRALGYGQVNGATPSSSPPQRLAGVIRQQDQQRRQHQPLAEEPKPEQGVGLRLHACSGDGMEERGSRGLLQELLHMEHKRTNLLIKRRPIEI